MANYEFAASSARPTLAVSQLSLGEWLLSSLGGTPRQRLEGLKSLGELTGTSSGEWKPLVVVSFSR